MSRIELGVGLLLACAATFRWTDVATLNWILLVFGIVLFAQGAYLVYLRPNLFLEFAVVGWISRGYWILWDTKNPNKRVFHLWLEVEDEDRRRIFIQREKDPKVSHTLAFTAPLALDRQTLRAIATRLSPAEQQKLYEELHVLLASMQLAYSTVSFVTAVIQGGLLIGEHLDGEAVRSELRRVSLGVAAARSLVRKTVLYG